MSFIGWNFDYKNNSWSANTWNVETYQDPYENLIPKRVKVSNRCVIVFWSDGTKTVAHCAKDDVFDVSVGIAIATAKKIYGSWTELLEFTEENVQYQPPKQLKEKKEETIEAETATETTENNTTETKSNN